MKLTGPWDVAQAYHFMDDARIPLRLAVNGVQGAPLVASLWFCRLGEEIWCATQADAHLVQRLQRDPRCGFEVAGDQPPYRGVRGRGEVRLHQSFGGQILRRLLERYGIGLDSKLGRFLLSREDTEVALEIAPARLTTWDYSERMDAPAGAAS